MSSSSSSSSSSDDDDDSVVVFEEEEEPEEVWRELDWGDADFVSALRLLPALEEADDDAEEEEEEAAAAADDEGWRVVDDDDDAEDERERGRLQRLANRQLLHRVRQRSRRADDAALGRVADADGMGVFDEWLWLCIMETRGCAEYARLRVAAQGAAFLVAEKQAMLRCHPAETCALSLASPLINVRYVRQQNLEPWIAANVHALQWFADHFRRPVVFVHRAKGWCLEYAPRAAASAAASAASAPRAAAAAATLTTKQRLLLAAAARAKAAAITPAASARAAAKVLAETKTTHRAAFAPDSIVLFLYSDRSFAVHLSAASAATPLFADVDAAPVRIPSIDAPLAPMPKYSRDELGAIYAQLMRCRSNFHAPALPDVVDPARANKTTLYRALQCLL